MKHLIPDAVFDQHVIVLGKTRSGKSSAMRLMVEHLLDKKNAVCIVDPKGDWWGLKASADGKHAGYPVVIFGGEHADVPLNSRSGTAVAELVATGNRSCIIDLGGWMPGESAQFWIDFASTFFRTHRGRHYLVIDEVHNFCPKGKIMDPNAGKMLHWSKRLASEGLGKGISILAASQRPQKVHNDFLTSCETLVAMRVIHKADRDALKDWVDGCGDPVTGKELLNTVASMKRGEAWAWSPEAEFGPKRIQFPMFSTYDSFKAQANQPAKLKGWAGVDLAEVTKKLESVVKEAEAKDPVKLQAQVADLKRQLASGVAKMPAKIVTETVVDKKATERAMRPLKQLLGEAMRMIVKINTIGFDEATVKPEDITKVLEASAKEIGKLAKTEIARRSIEFDRLRAEANRLLIKLKRTIENEDVTVDVDVKPKEPFVVERFPRRNAPVVAVGSNGDLKGPELKILNALAQLLSIGKEQPKKAEVAGWAGYSPIGGAFGNPIGKLRSHGLVDYPSPGTVSLTEEGLKIVGTQSPPTEDELRQRILNICSGPERKILAALIANGRAEMSKDDLAAASGYAPVGGAFGNPIGALRSKGFLDYPRPGMVQAAEWLFL